MVRQSTTTNNVRPETALENQYGYIPSDGTVPGCCNAHGYLSSQLEYDQADFALSRFLLAAPNPSSSDTSNAATLLNRANNWKNVFNPANKLLNPKLSERRASSAASPTPARTSTSRERPRSTASWCRFNQPALATLLGGNAATNSLLDSFFTVLDGSNGNDAVPVQRVRPRHPVVLQLDRRAVAHAVGGQPDAEPVLPRHSRAASRTTTTSAP